MNDVMREFKAYWQLADRMFKGATKEQLAETARILALQATHKARRYGELKLEGALGGAQARLSATIRQAHFGPSPAAHPLPKTTTWASG